MLKTAVTHYKKLFVFESGENNQVQKIKSSRKKNIARNKEEIQGNKRQKLRKTKK